MRAPEGSPTALAGRRRVRQVGAMAGLEVGIVPVTPFVQNCTLLKCTATGRGAVVDPGGDVERIVAAAEEMGITLEKILVTHGHIDHAGAVAELAERRGLPIEGPQEEDRFWIDSLAEQGLMFGLTPGKPFEPSRWLNDGDTVSVGEQTLEVIWCPGHTPGHVVFFHRPSSIAVVGDVLFDGSIGRTDFPKGNHATLIASIKNKLLPLGDEVTFTCGHGPSSTFGEQRRHNPFLR
jgi:hydroxyacylglutathione hydrolase